MTIIGFPFTWISRRPPPVFRNRFIEYFTVNLIHLFAKMDFLPPFWSRFFPERSHISVGPIRATFSTECYLGTELGSYCVLARHNGVCEIDYSV